MLERGYSESQALHNELLHRELRVESAGELQEKGIEVEPLDDHP